MSEDHETIFLDLDDHLMATERVSPSVAHSNNSSGDRGVDRCPDRTGEVDALVPTAGPHRSTLSEWARDSELLIHGPSHSLLLDQEVHDRERDHDERKSDDEESGVEVAGVVEALEFEMVTLPDPDLIRILTLEVVVVCLTSDHVMDREFVLLDCKDTRRHRDHPSDLDPSLDPAS